MVESSYSIVYHVLLQISDTANDVAAAKYGKHAEKVYAKAQEIRVCYMPGTVHMGSIDTDAAPQQAGCHQPLLST